MYKRTPEQLQAMASVFRSPGGQAFWEMLLDVAKDHDRTARKLDGAALYRAQGAADALEELALAMENSLTRRADTLRAASSQPTADRSAA